MLTAREMIEKTFLITRLRKKEILRFLQRRLFI